MFSIPLENGRYACGQIVGQEKEALNSVVCVLFETIIESNDNLATKNFCKDDVISIVFTTRDVLDNGVWQVLGNFAIVEAGQNEILRNARSQKFIGTDVVGSGNVMKFINAFHGFYPWNAMHDSKYFDKFLITSLKKPALSNLLFDIDEGERGGSHSL